MKPARSALLLAFCYVVMAGIYIVFSDEHVARYTVDVREATEAQQRKGLGFVLVSGAALFLLECLRLRRLQRVHDQLLREREALLLADRRALAGQLAASVAHDFNNYLTVIQAGIGELQSRRDATSDREVLNDMQEAATAGAQLARRLSQSGVNRFSEEPESVAVDVLIRGAVEPLRRHPSVRQCKLEVQVPAAAQVRTRAVLVQQMLSNLVINAAEATRGCGSILVSAEVRDTELVLFVDDDGPGIPEERHETLFDEVLSTKAPGRGLGLISVKACAALLSGRIQVSRAPLGGTRFAVVLPADGPSLPAPAAPGARAAAGSG